MVPDSGAAARADRLRPLNQPRPVRVVLGDVEGEPVALIERGQRREVERVEDHWVVEDEWWRQPISRRYYRVSLTGGGIRTLYHDGGDDTWYTQNE